MTPDQKQLFGTIAPPPGAPSDLGRVIGVGINLFLIVASLFMFLYMLLGAFDWIVSGGDKERVAKAQSKITNAIIGLFLAIVSIAVFNVVAGQVLNIITIDTNGWHFNIPHF